MMILRVVSTMIYLMQVASALHFYLETGESKCFFEDLPKDTLVVGKYDAYEFNKMKDSYFKSSNLAIEFTVEETFDNDHRVVQQRGSSEGDFTFTSLDSGEHKFCFTPKHVGKSWLESAVKTQIFLDLAVGDATDFIDAKRTDTINNINERVSYLSSMLKEIQRHQATVRDKESEFRSSSEKVNSNVVKWTLIQILILLAIGYAQLRYIRYYFKKEKVV